jgi:hypothetical protein
MRSLIAAVALVMVVATSACSYPDKAYVQPDARPLPDAPPDAPQGPFDCNGKMSPQLATGPQLTIQGSVQVDFNPGGTTGPVADATVAAFLQDNMTTPFDSQRSDSNGKFTLNFPTGGYAHPIVIKVTAGGYLQTIYYPAVPVYTNVVDLRLELFSATSAPAFMMLEGVDSLNLMLGAFAISVYDCNGKSLANATVSTVPSATMVPAVHYLVDAPDPRPSKTAMTTDGIFGLALAVNVPIGNTTIEATIPSPDDMSKILNLRSQLVTSLPNSLIQVDIQP